MQGPPACRYWTGVPGSCRRGDRCHFSHEASTGERARPQSNMPCRAWTGVPDSCRFGDACRFVHAGEPPAVNPVAAAGTSESVGFTRNQLNPSAASFVPADAKCCVCFETPQEHADLNGRPDRYGLLESCDHTVCLRCIMEWRQNSKSSKEARLGCPVCRTVSYLVVPWHKAAQGSEKQAVLERQKEKFRATKCKWSSTGKPCPAGKSCMFDHSQAPQVKMQRPHLCGLSRLLRHHSDDDDLSDVEIDDDLAAALIELMNPLLFRRSPRSRPSRRRRSASNSDASDSDDDFDFEAALGVLEGRLQSL